MNNSRVFFFFFALALAFLQVEIDDIYSVMHSHEKYGWRIDNEKNIYTVPNRSEPDPGRRWKKIIIVRKP